MKKIVFVALFLIILTACSTSEEYTPLVDSDNVTCDPDAAEGCSISEGSEREVGFEIGYQIPNIELTDFNGESVMLYDQVQGYDKFVLNFSTYWCPDCQREKEKMQIAFEEGDDSIGYAVVYIPKPPSDEDLTEEDIFELSQTYLSEEEYTFPVYFDYESELTDEIGISNIPHTFILDENAVIKAEAAEIDFDNLLSTNEDEINSQFDY